MATRQLAPRAIKLDGLDPALADRVKAVRVPTDPSPMLCTLVDKPFAGDEWIFEPKFDGLRVLAIWDGHELQLLSRNHKSQSVLFPDVADALRASLTRPAIVDGEVVCFNDRGRTSFRDLQQRFHLADPAEIERRMKEHPASIYLFDLLYLDRYDLTRLPLSERKTLLRDAVEWSDRVRWTEDSGRDGIKLWRKACRDGDEGIVAKRVDSPYVSGRGSAWVKIKCLGRQEFAIAGWTDPHRSRVGLGAILVGYYDEDRLIYAGKVGTGFTKETLLDLQSRFKAIGRKTCPFDGDEPLHGSGVHWLEPKLVAEVAFGEWTQNGLLRHPRFEGLRPDKSPRETRRERPRPVSSVREPRAGRSQSISSAGEATMPLQQYRAKRDFRRTKEPSGTSRSGKTHANPVFVIQEHHASHLHYDFRLEADGVLKSWAVPKEPTLDPSQKRLAVEVEDHPLDYGSFEGTIPEGQYGAGTVSIWDHGTYESPPPGKAASGTVTEAINAGHLEFTLHGSKLRGNFALIRMKGRGRGKPQWLLIKMKMKDESAEDATKGETETEAKPPKRSSKKISRVRADFPKRRTRIKPHPPAKVIRSDERAPAEIELTHPERVIFPEVGLTKKDVFEYYEQISDRLLPYLIDRPVTLERLPEGLLADAPHFWQKDTPDYYPSWIPRIALPAETGKKVQYALVNDRSTLLYLVNQGAFTFHVWASRVGNLDRPDFVLFDLDPGKASFGDVVEIARSLHALLDAQGAQSYVKTSGKAGLHVLVPWTAKGGYHEAREWASEFAGRLTAELPAKATVERLKAKRGKRVYIDVLQNARGHHAASPYVLRTVPTATVSTPLSWKEVTSTLDPAEFTPESILKRLGRQAQDPFAGLLESLSRPH